MEKRILATQLTPALALEGGALEPDGANWGVQATVAVSLCRASSATGFRCPSGPLRPPVVKPLRPRDYAEDDWPPFWTPPLAGLKEARHAVVEGELRLKPCKRYSPY